MDSFKSNTTAKSSSAQSTTSTTTLSCDADAHLLCQFQRADEAEAQTKDRPRRPDSWTLPLTIFFILLPLFALHFCLDDQSLIFFFKNLNPTPLPPNGFSHRDSWMAEPLGHHQLELQYQLLPPLNAHNPSTGWTFVLLHGLGDYHASESFKLREALLKLRPDLFESMRFIIPSAGNLPITVFGGQSRPAWFDIKNWTDVHQQEDVEHMKQNVVALNQIIQDNQIDINRTIIGGFSQGAVMSLLLSLNLENPPAGVIMLSGYAPVPDQIKLLLASSRRTETNKDALGSKRKTKTRTILHWLHGGLDPYFKIKFAQDGFRFLRELNYFDQTKFDVVPNLDHNWSLGELKILLKTLIQIINPAS